MSRADSASALLASIPMFTGRDWGFPEKNNRAAELAQLIQKAVHRQDAAEMTKLVQEVQHFMAPAYVLFKRLENLTKQERSWRTLSERADWDRMVGRARTIIQRKDEAEVVEIAQKIITFLRSRNEHVLAKSLEEALKVCKPKK